MKRITKPRLNLSLLHEELVALRQRVEDLEDLQELNQAIERSRLARGPKRVSNSVSTKP
ncbi:hypothetical protein LBMAG56_24800 [Verrucomicrobiota bacterium]|nr:hypothetical protein LBMAG56_24800 [Verrucomicrobiota bacterium]